MESLDGHEEKIGANRPTGAAYSRNFGGDNWADMRRKASAYDDREPAVLVIGAAQAGLSIAARLNQVGVDTLVVEKWPRIGDSWRKRYHSLALHNSIHLNHLPYMEFPPTWPKYIPKDMLGNWFEFYADAMEINCWTDTEFVGGTWDETAKCWTARLKRSDGTERIVRPRHLVFANGVSSYPMIPDLPGLEDFKGEVIHSEGFDSGADWTGQERAHSGHRQQRQRYRARSAQPRREHDADSARFHDRRFDRPERQAERSDLGRGRPAGGLRPDRFGRDTAVDHQGL